ncbi:aldehyde dehydrogenase family protein [Ktedonosporobacter rubrisoli]|uniref:Aldehyde dehydrogenase family protein n=1 Tax=Ktedonosporobacter rubrisoli TaxID=2509675 RepID=A0A4P6JVI5_KTERU|nr:aldehyde dehydrogenase family protein [Ktedonosporobacter rubrisoli]QBD79544.1 aldehyde dehydrogenase family protein [Ktedonosporobacter rubrisoli]
MTTLGIRNPRTGREDYSITLPEAHELARRCAELRAKQSAWSALGVAGRSIVLQRWKEELSQAREPLIQAVTTDTGRLGESVLELEGVLGTIERWCQQAPLSYVEERKPSQVVPFIQISSDYVPHQLVGIISPWNFPLLLSLIDAIPALLAGCAVLIKPSEVTPRFVAPLLETIARVPELRDVFYVQVGDGTTGATLIEYVDALCFTGSVANGRKVAEATARRFIPAFLELGGKDPAIVLPSTDLERATTALLWGSVVNTGQSCQSIERIYVARTIFDEFVARLVEKARQLKLAYPEYTSGQIGPIMAVRQAGTIERHLRDAVEKGARIHCGGAIETHGGGLWCLPTVLTNVKHTMLNMSEESFGPLLPVMAFDTLEEAISLANDSLYGLSASVFAGSAEEAEAVAHHLEAGAVSINDVSLTAFVHDGEEHSFKYSGLGGSRMGPAAIKRFLRTRALLTNPGINDPWWFPFPAPSQQ